MRIYKPFIVLQAALILVSATASGDSSLVNSFRGEPNLSTISKSGTNDIRGNQSCDFSVAEDYYRQDPDDLGNQVLYATCLVIQGKDSEGIPMLYHLADHNSSVTANFFLADYLETDGRFANPATDRNLIPAIHYYLRTQAIIALIPGYPEPDYFFHERNYQMHLKSIHTVPFLYLQKYKMGILGDYLMHIFASPNYDGDTSRETYPEYNQLMYDSLDKLIRYADECAETRKLRYFRDDLYEGTIKSCELRAKLGNELFPLEEKRQEILLRSDCKYAECEEYEPHHLKILDLIDQFNERSMAAFAAYRGE